MPNSYFKFKHFTIFQDRCAMKVTTDACLFGAWAADQLVQNMKAQKSFRLLDIGTGTGLLSLMLAQKTKALVDAIEIDGPACEQARENCGSSPWHDRIKVHCGDVKDFQYPFKYDYIISNPPFFEQQLLSPNEQTNQARHEQSLSFEELIEVITSVLLAEGRFAVLLPDNRADSFISLCRQRNFHLVTHAKVSQSTDHGYFRSMLEFGRIAPGSAAVSKLNIKDGNSYSVEFVALLKEYYLAL